MEIVCKDEAQLVGIVDEKYITAPVKHLAIKHGSVFDVHSL
jgi:hypothetical protein